MCKSKHFNMQITNEKVPSSMRKFSKFTAHCACARSHPDICFPLIHSVVSNDSGSG